MEILENPTSFRPKPEPTETIQEYFEIHFEKAIIIFYYETKPYSICSNFNFHFDQFKVIFTDAEDFLILE